MPRLHRTWPGNNRFLPCGCMPGPVQDICPNICVYLCFLGALIPYFIIMLPKIWKASPALPIVFLASVAASILCLNLAQCTDPGIIPRRPYLNRNPAKYKKYLQYSASSKLCSTCKIYRPKRAFHCSSCGNCVMVFDHHCAFVNNCIGMRNYRFFVSFLFFTVVSIILFFVNLQVYGVVTSGKNVSPGVTIAIITIVSVLVGIPLLGFLGFHIYLTCKGRTTRQLIKDLNTTQHQEEEQSNQWFWVDPSLVDYFEEISEEESNRITTQLDNLHHLELTAPTAENPNNMASDNTLAQNLPEQRQPQQMQDPQ